VILALVLSSFLALALVAALIFQDRANRRERQALLDRIQAPDVARAAAVEALLAPAAREPEPDVYDTPVLMDGDLQLDDLIGRS